MSEYPRHWEERLLGEVIGKITSGGTPKADNFDFYGGNIPFLKIDDITSCEKYLTTHKITITEKGLQESSAKIVPPGTILLTMYGTIGSCCITTYPVATNQAIASFLDHPQIDLEYLYYALQDKKSEFTSASSQTTQANISASILKNTPIAIPPVPEQKKIAEILSGVDRCISSKKQKVDKEKHCASLIASRIMKESDSQEVPLAEFAKLERGKFSHRPRNDPSFYGGDYPFIQTGDIPKNGIVISYHKQTLNSKGLEVSRIFPRGTLVITIAATIGEVGILEYSACFPDSLVGITPKPKKCNPIYLLFALRQLKETLLQMAPQSAQSNLNLEILERLDIPLPSFEIQNKIADIFSCGVRKSIAEEASIGKLEDLKSALASDLLSGRKRVSI